MTKEQIKKTIEIITPPRREGMQMTPQQLSIVEGRKGVIPSPLREDQPVQSSKEDFNVICDYILDYKDGGKSGLDIILDKWLQRMNEIGERVMIRQKLHANQT